MNLTKRGCLLCGSQCGVENCAICDGKTRPCDQCVAKNTPEQLARRWKQACAAYHRHI